MPKLRELPDMRLQDLTLSDVSDIVGIAADLFSVLGQFHDLRPGELESPPWSAARDAVRESMSGSAGDAAVRKLGDASGAAGTVAADNAGATVALAEGVAAITSAIIKLGRIAVAAIQEMATSLAASAATGPLAPGTAAMTVATSMGRAAVQAFTVLFELAGDLQAPTERLREIADRDVAVPQAPTPAAPPSPAALPSAAPLPGSTPAPTSAQPGSGEGPVLEPAALTDVPGAGGNGGAGAPTPQAQMAVDKALSAVGTPYQWGGNTPGVGLDCSGLTHWAYGEAGVDLPRKAEDQTVGTQVSQEELLPGDLVVWDGHVAMVTGDGMMVEAGDPVQVGPIRTTNAGMAFKGFWRPTA